MAIIKFPPIPSGRQSSSLRMTAHDRAYAVIQRIYVLRTPQSLKGFVAAATQAGWRIPYQIHNMAEQAQAVGMSKDRPLRVDIGDLTVTSLRQRAQIARRVVAYKGSPIEVHRVVRKQASGMNGAEYFARFAGGKRRGAASLLGTVYFVEDAQFLDRWLVGRSWVRYRPGGDIGKLILKKNFQLLEKKSAGNNYILPDVNISHIDRQVLYRPSGGILTVLLRISIELKRMNPTLQRVFEAELEA